MIETTTWTERDPWWLHPLADAVSQVQYKGWDFNVDVDERGVPFLQITFMDPELGTVQRCRKWLLYQTMNRSEVVRTAWMAVLAAEEHEARERFLFRGKRVVSPHVDLDALVDRGGVPVAFTEDPS